jgi:intracellular septation protein
MAVVREADGVAGSSGNAAFFDLLPLLLFFAAFTFWGIYAATAVAMAATGGQVLWLKLRGRPVAKHMWLTLGIITVTGGATIVLQDEWYIKLKPTALYWSLATALLVARIAFGRDLLQSMLGDRFDLPESGWRRMSLAWCAFLVCMGIANLFVASRFETQTWVQFKVFWSTGLMLGFSLLQAWMIAAHLRDKEPGAGV